MRIWQVLHKHYHLSKVVFTGHLDSLLRDHPIAQALSARYDILWTSLIFAGCLDHLLEVETINGKTLYAHNEHETNTDFVSTTRSLLGNAKRHYYGSDARRYSL